MNEFIKINSNMTTDADSSQVWLWDCGPPKPEPPKRPVAPKGKEGEPEFDLSMIEFGEALIEYGAQLKTYSARKVEHADFVRRYGGPYLIKWWSADAKDALDNDGRAVAEGRQTRRRYFMSSRTRGHEKLPNGGLPENMRPGHGHAENLRREEEGDAELVQARRTDPIFGAQELRP